MVPVHVLQNKTLEEERTTQAVALINAEKAAFKDLFQQTTENLVAELEANITQVLQATSDALLALDTDGRFLAMRADNLSNVGSRMVSLSPLSKGSGLITGSYDIPAAHLRSRAVFSNTPPTKPGTTTEAGGSTTRTVTLPWPTPPSSTACT